MPVLDLSEYRLDVEGLRSRIHARTRVQEHTRPACKSFKPEATLSSVGILAYRLSGSGSTELVEGFTLSSEIHARRVCSLTASRLQPGMRSHVHHCQNATLSSNAVPEDSQHVTAGLYQIMAAEMLVVFLEVVASYLTGRTAPWDTCTVGLRQIAVSFNVRLPWDYTQRF
jgi:hypothetical protein